MLNKNDILKMNVYARKLFMIFHDQTWLFTFWTNRRLPVRTFYQIFLLFAFWWYNCKIQAKSWKYSVIAIIVLLMRSAIMKSSIMSGPTMRSGIMKSPIMRSLIRKSFIMKSTNGHNYRKRTIHTKNKV